MYTYALDVKQIVMYADPRHPALVYQFFIAHKDHGVLQAMLKEGARVSPHFRGASVGS